MLQNSIDTVREGQLSKKKSRGPIASIWKNKGLNPLKSRSQFKNMLLLVNFTQTETEGCSEIKAEDSGGVFGRCFSTQHEEGEVTSDQGLDLSGVDVCKNRTLKQQREGGERAMKRKLRQTLIHLCHLVLPEHTS